MPVEPVVLEALNLRELDVPESLKINHIEVEPHVDWTGDDALRVTLVLDESVDPTKVPGNATSYLHRQIHDRLLAKAVRAFPYLFFVKDSERRQDAE